MRIRITSIPPGEAPENIRKAWVGLEIPVRSRSPGRHRGIIFGVLSGSKSRLISCLAAMFGFGQREIGYTVESKVAIDLLAARSPEAAQWWQQNTPRFIEPGRYFMFTADSCEELP